MGKRTETGVVIVGTGFSGLGMAIQLRKEGREDFVILEKSDDVGGTWRDNTYPGCACDIPSHMYSFSFEQNAGWSRAYSPQREIWHYLRGVAEKYDLRRFIRFGREMTGAHWDEEASHWNVSTGTGEEFVGNFLVAGIGMLNLPRIPELPGIGTFQGSSFHSAQWDHDFDLEGKKVAVVGTGASAIQFVPQIASKVAELSLFQRNPPWIMPKPDREMPAWARRAFRSVPLLQRAYRNFLYWTLEVRALGFNGHPGLMKLAERIARRHVGKHIADPELRRKVTPAYRLGCKRVLVSNDYYPALGLENVKVITDGVAEVREHSVVDGAGVSHEVDAIIYGTGFHVTDAFDDLDIVGTGGRNLGKEWSSEGMRTHLGITVSGYPNLFFLLGPNTGLGHNSVVFMIESQISYVAEAVRMVERSGAKAIDAREDVQARFNTDIQRKLSKGIWTQGGCKSWYLDAKGVNRTIWPGFTWRYWLDTRKVKIEDFELLGR
jgi:cation diffusion facilitator CzcD-associated flavoprotein CzcO